MISRPWDFARYFSREGLWISLVVLSVLEPQNQIEIQGTGRVARSAQKGRGKPEDSVAGDQRRENVCENAYSTTLF